MFSFLCFLVLLCINRVDLLNNGLALRPPMGWMSWGHYECSVDCEKTPEHCLNEKLIMDVADAFYNDGFMEAGYEYIVIDDCWSEMHRDKDGRLVADKKRFPHGMRYLADYIHAKGLKFGMYTNVADVTCKLYPGSRNYFEIDAQTFADWEVDFLKVDGCYVENSYLDTAYIKLGYYLNQTGRPILYSCSWPYYKQFIYNVTNLPYDTIGRHCNMWRDYHDVFPVWGSVRMIIEYFERRYELMREHHGPKTGWFDPDMLKLGTNALTAGQGRAQMAAFAMMSAPLIMSCDMKTISSEDRSTLLNLDLIAIAQDNKGLPAKPTRLTPFTTLWLKTHAPYKGNVYPSHTFAFINLGSNYEAMEVVPVTYGLNCTDGYTVLNVFTGQYVKNITLNETFIAEVPAEDALVYTLYPL